MENEEKRNITINGKQYYNLEEVPEPFREMVKAKIEASEDGDEISGDPKTAAPKDIQFDVSPGLAAFMKFMVKISQPPKPRATIPADSDTPDAEPENEPDAGPDLPGPEAVQPSSSGWIVWLAVIILAAFYVLHKTGLK